MPAVRHGAPPFNDARKGGGNAVCTTRHGRDPRGGRTRGAAGIIRQPRCL